MCGRISCAKFVPAAGHPKLGWVKFALSVRFAQGLRLNEEPESELPPLEQEERRETFWSVYLLDQLISLGPNRPPSFLDTDCHVKLPNTFQEGVSETIMPTLKAVVEDPTAAGHQNLGHFAMTIIVASALGRFIRSSLKRSIHSVHLPWDPRSKYYIAHSILLHFESHSPCSLATFSDVVRQEFIINNVIDQQRAGHFVFSHALFHLNHCLLNHPFVLHHLFQLCPGPIPLSFVQEALHRCYTHATRLLELLYDAQRFGPLVESSFYGYCAMAPGIILRLYTQHQDSGIAKASSEKVQLALDFLDRKPIRWANRVHLVSHDCCGRSSATYRYVTSIADYFVGDSTTLFSTGREYGQGTDRPHSSLPKGADPGRIIILEASGLCMAARSDVWTADRLS